MSSSRKMESLAKVLAHEGGYSNHKADPGGPTMKGVTQRVYDAYRNGKGQAVRSVRAITADELNEIFDKQYWDAVKGDLLPDGVDYVVFDGAVNSGPSRSIMWLQQALRPVYTGRIDGVIGVGTIAALNAFNNNDALINRICDARLAFLKRLPTWSTFGRGWSDRVKSVRAQALLMSAQAPVKALADPRRPSSLPPKAETPASGVTGIAPSPPAGGDMPLAAKTGGAIALCLLVAYAAWSHIAAILQGIF